MTTTASNPPTLRRHAYKVVLIDNHPLTDFDYGPFKGRVDRIEAKPERWHSTRNERVPASAAHWEVNITGADGSAWCSILLPLKRGRNQKSAIMDACEMFASPDDIQTRNSIFGSTIDVR